jgi:iron complex transport system substrate-binding protein
LERVAVVSTTHLPYFTALHAGPLVVGVAYTDQVRDAVVKDQIAAGNTAEIARADGLDRERLIALRPQVVFDYPFGSDSRSMEMAQPTIAVTEYLEDHPLGRAEWIRFFGLLIGREKLADSVFKAIVHRYEFVREQRGHLGAAPRVLFGSHWEQNWFVPPGNSYMARLIDDAGGKYLYADSVVEGNITLALEQVLVAGEQCDHIGVVLATQGRVDAAALAGDPRVARLDAVRKGGFFGNSATSDIFGQALLEPDVVLRDLRCIFHPRICAGHKPTYFFPIAQ